jgi:hypothetical protein
LVNTSFTGDDRRQSCGYVNAPKAITQTAIK